MSDLRHGVIWSHKDYEGTLELHVECSEYFLKWRWTSDEGDERSVTMYPSYDALMELAQELKDWY